MGPGTAPQLFCIKYNFSLSAASFNINAPCITSLCPPKYLVAECIMISAPWSKGFCKYGEAKVLSTQSKALAAFAMIAMAAISLIFINGLVGVSIQINFVLPVTAAFTLATSDVST